MTLPAALARPPLAAPVLLLTAAGCDGCMTSSWEPARADPGDVEIRADAVTVDTGRVGRGAHASEATYVLVDAVSRSDDDIYVTLGGELTAASGESLGDLQRESLRVPAGGQRTFALVDAAGEVRPQAEGARIDLQGTTVARHPPNLYVTDSHVYRDETVSGDERVIVAGRVENRAERRADLLVMAAFYGDGPAPIKRPFAVIAIEGGESYPVRFVGPPGSTRGYIFVGPATF